MAVSTTTLLQAVNRVLLDVGERRVTNLTSPPAEKAKNYLQEALRYLTTVHDWEWLYNKVVASNWIGDTFTVPTAQQVRGVSWLDANNVSYDLPFVDVNCKTLGFVQHPQS